jgi:hypothetical protein
MGRGAFEPSTEAWQRASNQVRSGLSDLVIRRPRQSKSIYSVDWIPQDVMKTFTFDEAQSLLPVLEALLKRAMDSKREAEEIESELSELGRRIYLSGGMRVDLPAVAKQRGEMEASAQRVRESIAEIDSIGVQVKDLDAGLLDFPFRLDEEIVLLCWRMGETTIEHWHTMDSGFSGRQPVDERFRRRSASGGRPN